MKRKIKLLVVIIAMLALAMSAIFATNASWIGNSIVSITSATATDTFTTKVVGISTNASATPIDVNGVYYTSATIGTFAPPVQSGDPNTPSTVTISASGFVPNDYATFQVTITNTGSATLAFAPYTYTCEFVGDNS